MSCTASSVTTRLYGVKLVCRTWEQPRSSYYISRRDAELPVCLAPAGKRGPKTVLSDTECKWQPKNDPSRQPKIDPLLS